jgi:hypothetical protein
MLYLKLTEDVYTFIRIPPITISSCVVKYLKLFFIAVLAIVLVYFILYNIVRSYQLNKYGRYTIAQTKGTHHTARGSKSVNFEFEFKDEVFSSSAPYRSGMNVDGGNYYVKFSYANPKYCVVYFNKPYLYDPLLVPDSGWVSIPRNPYQLD